MPLVKGLIWLGTRTDRFDEMVSFVERVLGLPTSDREPGLAIFELDDGSLFEVFGPEHPGGGHPSRGVVAGFQVDDIVSARQELVTAGIWVSEVMASGPSRWAYFRAPDGNLYEVAQPD